MNQLPQGYPVHYVITLPRHDAITASMYTIGDIVGSFACDVSEIPALYERYVLPLHAKGLYAQAYIFGREGPNPFLEAEKKHRQKIEDMLAQITSEQPKAEGELDYRDDAAWEERHEP